MKIARYPEYEIFEDGRIMRFGKCLKHIINRFGYPIVYLYNNKKRRQEFVHILLLEAFVPKPDPSYNQGNHINGVKTDNRLENLEWCNNSQNQLHAYKLGLRPKNSTWRIDRIQSEVIRICRSEGISSLNLSKYFGITTNSIRFHIKNKAKYYVQSESGGETHT